MKTKVCASCKEEKTIECFSLDRNEKDGYKRYCKDCVSKKSAEYRQKHAEKIRECHRLSYWKSKEKADERTAEQEKTPTRVCSVCGIEKTLSEFYKCGNGGYRAYCKKCANSKAREYHRLHRDRVILQKRQYHKTHKAEIDDYNHDYYRKRSEEVKKRVRDWKAANPIQARETHVIAVHKKLSRQLGLETDYTKHDWHKCKEFFSVNGQLQCAYCGKPIEGRNINQEHVIPRIAGGCYVPENIIPACTSCNSSKSKFDFLEWYRKQPFYSAEREKRIIEYCEMACRHREGCVSDSPCNA